MYDRLKPNQFMIEEKGNKEVCFCTTRGTLEDTYELCTPRFQQETISKKQFPLMESEVYQLQFLDYCYNKQLKVSWQDPTLIH